MYIPKRYGQSKIDSCPFCGKTAVTVNSQKIPVCTSHKNSELSGLKCLCGETLDILHGKFGVFFSCLNCGNMNLKKVLEFNDIKEEKTQKTSENNSYTSSKPHSKSTTEKKQYSQKPKSPKEITIRSDDPNYF